MIYDNQDNDRDLTKWDTVETLFLVGGVATAAGKAIKLGEKVTTVNFEDIATNAQNVKFNDALTAATVGVNKVGIVDIPGTPGTAASVTVAGTALKKLTVDAYGKASNVNLIHAANTIETLDITGKADLKLSTAVTSIKTVDGSKAEGKLELSKLANMTSVKTGSGNDTVTLVGNAASGDTINLGAGNDKLLKGAGSVVASTTTVIDGGAGIDSLDAILVNAGNEGVFANFEILSLTTTGANLDLDLVKKSTFTTIALDGAAITSTVKNVSTSQSLTVNTTGASTTILLFKNVAGTADAYTINFDKETTGATFDAGTVTIDGIETVTVNSVGKTSAATDTNKINLDADAAKSLVITGDKALDVAFTAFGDTASATNGLGVSTIDASASTAGITLTNLTNLVQSWSGLTIKGGAGVDSITTGTIAYAINIDSGAGNDKIILTGATTATEKIIVNAGAGNDNITVGAKGGTFTLGAGNDTINVKDAAVTTVGAGGSLTPASVYTTITDIDKGDKIQFAAIGTFVKTNVSTATDLDSALALTSANAISWFQFAGNTYIVDGTAGAGTAAGIQTADVIVKLNGQVDLGNSTFTGADLTIA